ncbi:hypothetical protein TRFO_18319 [Tritrichomonas foetus]|uniref:RING-type domain-containing protein n=1 Tax=Tritrichomonas foetus TaxID=1144522 RepID=A0A1J4KL42_9EUKA|nr:hypothetical protein TRFO_18319 [Tritrichomonas foetus]|eukprot:OHT12025.1 hypothetical protein TRFO_18319 [Tritrichomonas foetus]
MDEKHECGICYEPFSTDNKPMTLVPCGHTLCASCFGKRETYRNLCPFCKKGIDSGVTCYMILDLIEEYENMTKKVNDFQTKITEMESQQNNTNHTNNNLVGSDSNENNNFQEMNHPTNLLHEAPSQDEELNGGPPPPPSRTKRKKKAHDLHHSHRMGATASPERNRNHNYDYDFHNSYNNIYNNEYDILYNNSYHRVIRNNGSRVPNRRTYSNYLYNNYVPQPRGEIIQYNYDDDDVGNEEENTIEEFVPITPKSRPNPFQSIQ